MGQLIDSGRQVRIALVGDYNPDVPAHQAIGPALEMAAADADVALSYVWLPTPEVQDTSALAGYDGIWCVPASPYLHMDGALLAIRHARQQRVPFLGTCGGFQHALIEYARNQLGWQDAEHAETSPESDQAIITALSCSLVDAMAEIQLTPGSLIARVYGAGHIVERYQCRYGLRAELYEAMFGGELKASGRDAAGEIRAIELQGHPFYIATLFQPERAALLGRMPALVAAFVRACALQSSHSSELAQ